MITLQKSEWQEIGLSFFREEVWPRFWNHTGRTKELIIEIQYMPALLCREPWRRAFIGYGLGLNFPYSQRKESLGDYILKEHGINAYRDYEKNFALGFCMTGDKTYEIDYVPLANGFPSKDVFMRNLGVCDESPSSPIFLWYNLNSRGKIEKKDFTPGPNSMIRVRFLSVPYCMGVIKDYVESGFRDFPDEFLEDDYKI